MNPIRRIPLFKRLPKLRLPKSADNLIKPEKRNQYPAFVPDLATLDQELLPFFRELDNQALQSQNAYRRMYVILILGSAVASMLAIAQIAFLDTAWIGFIGGVVALVLGAVTTISNSFKYQKRYLNARLAAERLRSEYFLFLGRFDPYADEQDRLSKLRERVAEIKAKGEAL